MALQKAFICPFDGAHTNRSHGNAFYVPFNPAELSIEEAVGLSDAEEEPEWAGKEIQNNIKFGRQYPVEDSRRYRRKDRIILSMTLHFNTLTSLYQSSYKDVRQEIKKLYYYDNKNLALNEKPRQLYFEWGTIGVSGILTRMHVRYTMFSPDGKPVRAQVELSIEGQYFGDEIPNVAAADQGDAGQPDSEGSVLMPEEGWSAWREANPDASNPRLRMGDSAAG